jgi:hypothetical protein
LREETGGTELRHKYHEIPQDVSHLHLAGLMQYYGSSLGVGMAQPILRLYCNYYGNEGTVIAIY